MSRPLALVIDDATFLALENAAGRAGQSPADFLTDQLAVALGSSRVRETAYPRRRSSQPSSRRASFNTNP